MQRDSADADIGLSALTVSDDRNHAIVGLALKKSGGRHWNADVSVIPQLANMIGELRELRPPAGLGATCC